MNCPRSTVAIGILASADDATVPVTEKITFWLALALPQTRYPFDLSFTKIKASTALKHGIKQNRS